MEQLTGSKLGKQYDKVVYCLPAYLTYMQSTSCKMPGIDECQTGIKISGRNINSLRYADDITLIAESETEIKSLLRKMKEESKKTDLKLNIQKAKIMASGPIISCQIEREKVEAVTYVLFLGSKITADGDCSHEIERCLLLGRKAMTNLNSILKSRDIILLTKFQIAKVMVFPVFVYGCECKES